MSESEPPSALQGIRVVTTGQILAAPYCATLLAEFGAEVIKVEQPGSGDPNRDNLSFWQDNRGVKSVTIDLHHAEGKALFIKLCDTADILIENFRPGTLEGWGVGPDTLRETNPGLIAVRISGYGQTGPYREKASFDRVALAFSGMTYTTGYADRPPVRPGFFVADYGAGTFAAFGAMVALQGRNVTGRGQDVDVALYEAAWRMSGTYAAGYGITGKGRERSGNYFPGVVPAEQFTTSDGHFLVVNCTTQRAFDRLCEAIGQPELLKDPRFAKRRDLQANYEQIHAILGAWIAPRTLAECQAVFDAAGAPAIKVHDIGDILADPQYAARDMVISVEAPGEHGHILQPGIVPRLSETPGRVRMRGPHLGEHNEAVFGSLGYGPEEVERLKTAKAI